MARLRPGIVAIYGAMEINRSFEQALREPVPGLAMYIPDSGVTMTSLPSSRESLRIAPGKAYFYSAEAGPYKASMKEKGTYSGLKVFLSADVIADIQTRAAKSYRSDPVKLIFSEIPVDRALVSRIATLPKPAPERLNSELEVLADLNRIVADTLSLWMSVETGDGSDAGEDSSTQIEAADHYLKTHLAEPPSVLALANMVGLNHMTMQRGFRRAYGTTVYGRLRYWRMQHAETRLAGGASVTETALEVGYANPSKFAAAFRREMGRNPSDI